MCFILTVRRLVLVMLGTGEQVGQSFAWVLREQTVLNAKGDGMGPLVMSFLTARFALS